MDIDLWLKNEVNEKDLEYLRRIPATEESRTFSFPILDRCKMYTNLTVTEYIKGDEVSRVFD